MPSLLPPPTHISAYTIILQSLRTLEWHHPDIGVLRPLGPVFAAAAYLKDSQRMCSLNGS